MVISSGSPFNITSPIDLNGDQLYNDRPGLISTATCPTNPSKDRATEKHLLHNLGHVRRARGWQTLPINYGTGPAHFVMNLRFTKTFGFGPKAKASGQGPGGGGDGGRHGGGRGGPLFGGGPSFSSGNSDRRYNLTLGVNARNLFNVVNVANPNAVLGSRLFDVSNDLQGGPFSPGTAANRKFELQATFNF